MSVFRTLTDKVYELTNHHRDSLGYIKWTLSKAQILRVKLTLLTKGPSYVPWWAPVIIGRRKTDPCFSVCLTKGPSYVHGRSKSKFLQLIEAEYIRRTLIDHGSVYIRWTLIDYGTLYIKKTLIDHGFCVHKIDPYRQRVCVHKKDPYRPWNYLLVKYSHTNPQARSKHRGIWNWLSSTSGMNRSDFKLTFYATQVHDQSLW